MNIDQLAVYAKNIGLENLGSLTKSQMVFEVAKLKSTMPNEVLAGEGVLEVLPDGFGFLRSPNYNYLPFCRRGHLLCLLPRSVASI